MNEKDQNEFYVGYHQMMKPLLKKHIVRTIGIVAFLVLVIALALVFSQTKFHPSFYEDGNLKTFEGTIIEKPYPLLLVKEGNSRFLYYLVDEGKHGAQDLLRDMDGFKVRLKGVLIHLGDQKMIELREGSLKSFGVSNEVKPPLKDLGEHQFIGEIEDSKCFFGAMNPGEGQVHQACALRCISGGIPPIYVVRDQLGQNLYLLLEGKDGRALNQEVLDMIALPVEIKGDVIKEGNIFLLKAEPNAYKIKYSQ